MSPLGLKETPFSLTSLNSWLCPVFLRSLGLRGPSESPAGSRPSEMQSHPHGAYIRPQTESQQASR